MTREELYKIAKHYAQDELKDSHSAVEDVVAAAFIDGVNYADAHPHWISVGDELPPMKGKSGQSDDVLVRLYNGRMDIDSYNFGYEEWEVDDKYITHWMPLPQAPSCSEFPNNSKKGGEE